MVFRCINVFDGCIIKNVVVKFIFILINMQSIKNIYFQDGKNILKFIGFRILKFMELYINVLFLIVLILYVYCFFFVRKLKDFFIYYFFDGFIFIFDFFLIQVFGDEDEIKFVFVLWLYQVS